MSSSSSENRARDGQSPGEGTKRRGWSARFTWAAALAILVLAVVGTWLFLTRPIPAHWTFDPNLPGPVPTDSQVHVVVTEDACNENPVAPHRIHEPAIRYEEDVIVITFRVNPLRSGVRTCFGGVGTPYVVELEEPIGNRALVDGSNQRVNPRSGPDPGPL